MPSKWYCNNDPINCVDPTGLWEDPIQIRIDGSGNPFSSNGTNNIGNAFKHCSNIVGITPPHRLLHRFVNNSIDFLASYLAPESAGSKTYQYDSDKRLRNIASEENRPTTINYGNVNGNEANNKIIGLSLSNFDISYRYHPHEGTYISANRDGWLYLAKICVEMAYLENKDSGFHFHRDENFQFSEGAKKDAISFFVKAGKPES